MSQTFLGKCFYQGGLGTTKNLIKAIEYLEMAMEQVDFSKKNWRTMKILVSFITEVVRPSFSLILIPHPNFHFTFFPIFEFLSVLSWEPLPRIFVVQTTFTVQLYTALK